VQINWNVENILRFQRNFQFQAGVNTLLRFRYERLRGFCEVCGMLTHDSGACVITNGGHDSDSEGDDDDDIPNAEIQNQGVEIREIEEGEENGGPNMALVVEAPDDNMPPIDDIDPQQNLLENADDDLQDYQPYSMYQGESDTNELFNPISIFANATGDIPGDESYARYSASIHPREEVMSPNSM